MLAKIPLLISAVAAFTLPDTPNDGIYKVRIDDNGNEIHEPISSTAISTDISARSLLAKQDSSNPAGTVEARSATLNGPIWCGCDIKLNETETDAAVSDLKSQAGNGTQIEWGQSYYSTRGGVVAFACAHDGQVSTSAANITDALKTVTEQCGRYVAGTYHNANSTDEFWATIGYMRYEKGVNFCELARNSKSGKC
ncbi:hypothetical protein V8F20_008680 [Naviculisporaceae sp. PSN 640]